MIACTRLGGCGPALLHRNVFVRFPITIRSLATIQNQSQYSLPIIFNTVPNCAKRTFAVSARFRITGLEAPSAQAYISSGILAGRKNLVDVKKVLVIGSGGLSIGQAGEFDYSGKIGSGNGRDATINRSLSS